MTDSERIEALEKQVAGLNSAIIALTMGGAISVDAAGNFVATTTTLGGGPNGHSFSVPTQSYSGIGHPAYTGASPYNPYNT